MQHAGWLAASLVCWMCECLSERWLCLKKMARLLAHYSETHLACACLGCSHFEARAPLCACGLCRVRSIRWSACGTLNARSNWSCGVNP